MEEELFPSEQQTENCEKVRITAFEAENVKRIKAVSFAPTDTGLTVIGGNNRQGKTSVLDEIAWLLGGAKFAPSNYKNNEAVTEPYGKITLSNGLTVERKGKNASLHVTDTNGKKAGQELLNEFISAFALDLPKFLNAGDKEKAFILLDTLGIKDQLLALDDRENTLYDERTEIGRIALRLEKHAQEMPFFDDAPEEEISAASIIEKQQAAVEQNNANAEIRRQRAELEKEAVEFESVLKRFDDETSAGLEHYKHDAEKIEQEVNNIIDSNIQRIADLQQEIENLTERNKELALGIKEKRTKIAETASRYTNSRNDEKRKIINEQQKKHSELIELRHKETALAPDVDLSIFKTDIEALEEANAKFRANAEHDKAAEIAREKQSEYDEHTKLIEDVRRERMELLSSVKMPLPGLTVKDAVLYYNGEKWDCMSGAEQMIVGTSIVRSINPACGFVLLDKLEQMDLDTLKTFGEWLKKENLQAIGTRVSKGEECTIIIEDGTVINK